MLLMLPMPWMNGWPGAPTLVINYDATDVSDATDAFDALDVLDKRVAGCCDPRDGLRCLERTGVRVS